MQKQLVTIHPQHSTTFYDSACRRSEAFRKAVGPRLCPILPYSEGAQFVFGLDLLQYRGRADHPRPTGGQEGVPLRRVCAGQILGLSPTLQSICPSMAFDTCAWSLNPSLQG